MPAGPTRQRPERASPGSWADAGVALQSSRQRQRRLRQPQHDLELLRAPGATLSSQTYWSDGWKARQRIILLPEQSRRFGRFRLSINGILGAVQSQRSLPASVARMGRQCGKLAHLSCITMNLLSVKIPRRSAIISVDTESHGLAWRQTDT